VLAVEVRREGAAAAVGHDLRLEVTAWQARTVPGGGAGEVGIALTADPDSLVVAEAHGGVKPLSDADRATILRNLERQVLRGRPIAFRSSRVERAPGGFTVAGELTLADQTGPLTVRLELEADGALRATARVRQSDWGIRPFRALLGALRVRDEVEVELRAPREAA
jgi:polyisoprenoid-binding protein YceI